MGRPAQLGFNAGVFGKRMYARTDLARYRFACRQMNNFIPTVQGPALKRSGTRFVKNAKGASSQQSRLIPFEFSRDQAYVLEFFDNGIRFMRDGGAVLETAVAISVGTPPSIANPCVITTNVNHGYSTGDEVFITGSRLAFLNDQFFTITVTGLTTFTLEYDGAVISSLGESLITAGTNTVARTYQITNGVGGNAIPWNYDELDSIAYAQDADVMYLVHPSYAPHKLTRTSDTSWTCAAVDFVWPPFRDENITSTTVYTSSATSATATIEASTNIFTSDMVGGFIQLSEVVEAVHPVWTPSDGMGTEFSGGVAVNDRVRYDKNVYYLSATNGASITGTIAPVHEDGTQQDRAAGENAFDWTYVNRGMGYAKIETYTDANTVVADVLNEGIEFPASVVGSGGATKKWAISAFNAEYGYPTAVAIFEGRLWFGGTDRDPQTFWGSRINRYEDFQIRADDPDSGLSFTIASNRVNAIQWMAGQDVLVIGTRGGEFTAESESNDVGITPDNIKVRQMSAFGSATDVPPVFVDSALIVAHRNGRRINEMVFDDKTQSYLGVDLTAVYDEAMSNEGVRMMAYQASPFRQVLALDNSGNLKSFTYNREEEVTGWSSFVLAGNSAAGFVDSVCVIPHPDGDSDQVWMVVLRTTPGGVRRYVEYLEKPFLEGDSETNAFFVDAGVTYTGSATTTVNGLLHLAGSTVDYFVPSSGTVGSAVVTSKGKLTVPSSTDVHIGFAVSAALETMDFEGSKPPVGSSHGDKTRIATVAFRLSNSGPSLQYSNDKDSTTFDTYTWTDLLDGVSPQFSVPGSTERGGARVAVKHETPRACTLEAIFVTIAGES